MRYRLRFRWGTSRGRDTYGYAICTLFVNGDKRASCNGGGYDMKGTSLGIWIAETFPDRLNKLIDKEYYGLTFHDPNYDPGKAKIGNETVEDREAAGKSLGLERYQAFYSASSKLPTERHTVPSLDGACGFECMVRVLEAIGGKLEYIDQTNKESFYTVTMPDEVQEAA